MAIFIYISGRTGKYLEPAVGKANMNIFAMLRPGFQNDFAMAFRKASNKKRSSCFTQHVKIGTNGDSILVNVNIHWIQQARNFAYGKIMIIFTDVPPAPANKTARRKGKTHCQWNKGTRSLRMSCKIYGKRFKTYYWKKCRHRRKN
jgi:two-component system, chemotaxis family, CheB/CheR fusion protein